MIDDEARDALPGAAAEIDAELDNADAAGDRRAVSRFGGRAGGADRRAARRLRARGPPSPRWCVGGAAARGPSRVRDAVQRIEAAHPALGRHLAHSVRTGSYCVYQPDPPVDWTAGEAPHTV